MSCNRLKAAMTVAVLSASAATWAVGPAEQSELVFGFIKLTDMAPLAVARERGYFAAEGLDVALEAQSNWQQLLQAVVDGNIDGAHMLAPQPLAAKIGYGGIEADIVVPLSLDLNGNAITVSNSTWEAMRQHVATGDDGRPVHPIPANALKPLVDAHNARGEKFRLGMVFPVSTHNYELRYWLAAGGIHPGFLRLRPGPTWPRATDGSTPKRSCSSPHRRRCRDCWPTGSSAATASVSHGISRRWWTVSGSPW